MKSGVYIHIPFCEQRCGYCAFTVAVAPVETFEPYVKRLIREIELSGWNEPVETIFLGGGTPSLIEPKLIREILATLPQGATEISLEANPGTFTDEKLETYREVGINRISLGAQSFSDRDLEAVGRIHRAAHVVDDFATLRRDGFKNINIDLIAGLPSQDETIWSSNLDWLERLQPEHVSVYMLELDEKSPWSRGAPEIPADDVFVRQYQLACDRLEAAGYRHYEISNWAKPGFECRHNLKYWTGARYRGFGVGAHSYDGDARFWNTSSLAEYAAQIDAGHLPMTGREVLTREIRLEEAFMLGLRQTAGFSIRAVAEDLGIRYPSDWFTRVETLQSGGLVSFDGDILKLTSAGWLVATGVTEDLIWPTLLSTSEVTP